MAGAEAVGPGPLHALEVPLGHRPAEAAADDVGVLVLAEAFQVDRLPVDEDAAAVDLDGADADLLLVAVIAVPGGQDDAVEIGAAHLPQMGVFYPQHPLAAFGLGHGIPLGVRQADPDGAVPAALDGIVDQGVGAVL